MNYKSTRDNTLSFSAAQAITEGISKEGGLFVPEFFPVIEQEDLEVLAGKRYKDRAIEVLSLFLTDFSDEDLVNCVSKAYTAAKFGTEEITRLHELSKGRFVLELWHGPTCAFKDMALQLLPHLLKTSAGLVGTDKEIVILVATSGDTGKAALEGFKGVEGTRIIVFYPEDGVSPMQKRQMVSQEGDNVHVCAIKGNFDDAQTAVKSIFTDRNLARAMEQRGKLFSSANSINFGRLVPQIVYYVSVYADLLARKEITLGEEVNVCVPTGNFGNILAAYYAKKMGVPFGKLICASNENKVLTDFINTGVYSTDRDFKTTISPSMDILISSNLERLLFDLTGCDDGQIRAWYEELRTQGRFDAGSKIKEKLESQFYAGFCDDAKTKETIQKLFAEEGYLCDTHTAVGVSVYDDYRQATGDTRKTILVSTANPYKFADSVLTSLQTPTSADEYDRIEELREATGLPVPEALAGLREKAVRFPNTVSRTEILSEVLAQIDN